MADWTRLKQLTHDREMVDALWREEILRLSKIYSTRLIAEAAGITHTAVWKMVKRETR